ncbi:MAG: hypothetical protein INH13_25645 [Cupriavidus sp.]|nr:hypothetical protein [Cupriavidus sp.]
MDQRIIYPTDNGGVAVIIPAPDCGLPIEEIARKDVPAGKPFKIVSVSDIPEDRTFRAAWGADIAEPDGEGIGAEAWFAEKEAEKEAAE